MMAINALENAFTSERNRLVHWMTSLTGDPLAADDLVQETFLTAWENRHKLTDPSGVTSWLNAIAHNIYKRWSRKQGKQWSREADLLDMPQDPIAEYALERNDLADLLDKAMDMLPPETRTILLARYLEEQPQAKVARDMGLSESAVAVRLHRGKMALRKVIDMEQQSLKDDDGWEDTRIWCGLCGEAHYRAKFISETGELTLICPKCNPNPKYPAWGSAGENDILRGMKSVKPAFKRMMVEMNTIMNNILAQGYAVCPHCESQAQVVKKMPDFVPSSDLGLHINCSRCGVLSYMALNGVAGSTPQAIRLWKDNPRFRTMKPHYLHHQGQEAIRIPFESLHTSDTLDVLFACDTYQILSVYRNGKFDDES